MKPEPSGSMVRHTLNDFMNFFSYAPMRVECLRNAEQNPIILAHCFLDSILMKVFTNTIQGKYIDENAHSLFHTVLYVPFCYKRSMGIL